MFLGLNHSVCVHPDEFPGLRPDCIYFTVSSFMEDSRPWFFGWSGVKIYNLKNNTAEDAFANFRGKDPRFPPPARNPAALLRSWVRLPVGANFRLRLKKSPRLSYGQSTGLRSGPVVVVSHGLRCRCVRVGQRFGGFLDLCERIFSSPIESPGAVIPPAGPVLHCQNQLARVLTVDQLEARTVIETLVEKALWGQSNRSPLKLFTKKKFSTYRPLEKSCQD
ncbi:hypothetical protein EJB05_35505, partial [Eragrostis curvula]